MSKPQVRRVDEPHVPAGPSLPAGRFAPPLRPVATRRRPAMIALGVALVVVGALGMVAIVSSLGKTQQVLAVTAHVQRGEVIKAQDLTVAEIPVGPTALSTVPKESLDDVVGQVAADDLKKGSLLAPNSYAKTLVPVDGTVIIGVALEPAKMPTDAIRSGDKVLFIEVTDSQRDDLEPREIEATVVSVNQSTLGEKTLINVQINSRDRKSLPQLTATGKVVLALDSVHG